jgi:hypothetical protein
VVKRSNSKHLAGASLAGSLFQLERALCHLASAEIDAVGVEHVDDVASFRDDRVVAQEQDKHSISREVEVVADRSRALWRTLQIWVGQRRAGSTCGRYLLAANTEVTGQIARQIKRLPLGEVKPSEIVAALRAAGTNAQDAHVVAAAGLHRRRTFRGRRGARGVDIGDRDRRWPGLHGLAQHRRSRRGRG